MLGENRLFSESIDCADWFDLVPICFLSLTCPRESSRSALEPADSAIAGIQLECLANCLSYSTFSCMFNGLSKCLTYIKEEFESSIFLSARYTRKIDLSFS